MKQFIGLILLAFFIFAYPKEGALVIDGQTYKTVRIGTQTWMAKNLNNVVDSSWCYENSAANCKKYGRLYTWKSAMTACPDGWHLPSQDEWWVLYKYVYSNNGDKDVGTSLKSTSGWKYNSETKKGTNDFGFSALPARARTDGDFEDNGGNYTDFWSATEYDSSFAVSWGLSYSNDLQFSSSYKISGFSVRCLKN